MRAKGWISLPRAAHEAQPADGQVDESVQAHLGEEDPPVGEHIHNEPVELDVGDPCPARTTTARSH
jgi:hypothetical protein